MIPFALLAAAPSDTLVAAAEAAIAQDRETAIAALDRSRASDRVRGLAMLVLGDLRSARSLLSAKESPVYFAMAQAEGAGGIGRARQTLARASEVEPAGAGELFLAALAFASAGGRDRAHVLLDRAITSSDGALSEAFAPDAAVGLARAVLEVDRSAEARARLGRALLRAGRRAETIRMADDDEILAEAWEPIDPRKALAHAKSPSMRAELSLRLGELDRARAVFAERDAVDARGMRVQAELFISEGAAEKALDLAEQAARLEPKSIHSPRLVAEALFLAKDYDRAAAFAAEVLRRRPFEVDPFALVAKIDGARGRTRELRALELRSQGLDRDRMKVERERKRREDVIRAVRDAEAGLGETGLEAVRGKDAALSLPVDLALAKSARPGTARAARDRILAACADDWVKLLTSKGAWDRVRVEVSPYGRAETVTAPLSAADPARCGGRVLRK